MLYSTNEAIILDWQNLCPDHPIMDLAFLICTSLTPENLDNWTTDLIQSYFNAFKETCARFGVEMPFQLKELNFLFFDNGVWLIFFCWLSAYEETISVQPHYKKRFMWQLENCLKVSPKLFE